MPLIRTVHAYLGIFIAPSVIFFCVSGALQLFDLHQAHDGYTPPSIVERLGMLHTEQVFALKPREAESAASDADAVHAAPTEPAQRPSIVTSILKYYFLIVAVALAASTLFGLWIGLRHPRYRRVGWVLLALGAAIPVVLSMF